MDEITLKILNQLPILDDRCGKYLTFRDFIECGETQKKTGIQNIPKQIETYEALEQLAKLVLDPVSDNFGQIELTYGFCSRELAKEIPGRIYPKLDQHASYELNTRGNLICERVGAAVDFIIEGENMIRVAKWLVKNTAFDRLYIYGDYLPLHVSIGPDNSRQIIMMNKIEGKKQLVPKRIDLSKFLSDI